MTQPRLLTIMGSGETAPTMVKVHRSLLERLGPPPVPAAVVDTPFGFQENADDITARAVAYFAESVGADLGVVRYRSLADTGDTLGHERAMARLREARYVFAGPGSPTYALEQWAPTSVPDILREKLERGGCVTFASAAAVTLGILTVPVYEIYKVGAAPEWRTGLNLLSAAGLTAAVIPHYNNAEGGNHDTRFCYLGERRLAVMEKELPEDAFVLGVDEHTGLVMDVGEGTASIVGLGVVTVRRHGVSHEVPAGTTIPIGELRRLAFEKPAPAGVGAPAPAGTGSTTQEYSGEAPAPPGPRLSPLLQTVRSRQDEFDAAMAAGDPDAAVAAILGLDDDIQAWSADTLQSDEPDKARAALRSMIVRLGEASRSGLRDPRQVVAPFVEAVLGIRDQARRQRRFTDADGARDALEAAGVEVRDTPEGTRWDLR